MDFLRGLTSLFSVGDRTLDMSFPVIIDPDVEITNDILNDCLNDCISNVTDFTPLTDTWDTWF